MTENNGKNASKVSKTKQINYNSFLMTLIKCVVSKDEIH